MSLRTWILERLGGTPKEELQKALEARGGFEVVVEARESNRANAETSVTPESSLRLSAVYACVRVLGETMSTLPLHWYERMRDGGRRPAENYYLARVFDNPNPFMTGFDLTETMTQHLALRGNAYCQIEYDERGQIVEFWPLLPQNFMGSRIVGDQRIYEYIEPTGKPRKISSDILWHMRLMGDGLTGFSPIGLNRRAAELGLSAEEFGKKFFDNDARPGIVLEHPGTLKNDAHERLRTSWDETHKGASKSHRVAILEEGMKIHEVGIPPEDAQFLETRKFQVNEIARIFRVPPHMIGDLERSTNNNIEHQGIEFVKFTVLPWARRKEQSIMKFLMLERERLRYYPEHLMDILERGDLQTRYSAYAVGRQNGFLSANDIRQKENMQPIDGGDVYLVPMNMVPADMVGALDASTEGGGGSPDTARGLGASDQGSGTREESPLSPLDKGGKEERGRRSAGSRHRLAGAQRRVILDVAERVMRREVHDVGEAVRKYLGKRDTGQFMIWLDGFYEEHAQFMTRQFLPVFLAYAEMVAAEAQDETASEMDLQDRLERFVRSYTGSFASQQVGISLFRLKEEIKRAMTGGEDLAEALDAELGHWNDARPGEMAMEQATRANNATAKFVYAAVGIQILRWVAIGKTCPYCSSLDGKTIEINKYFLTPGQKLEGGEGVEPLETKSNVGHPPVHDGCDCMVVAG